PFAPFVWRVIMKKYLTLLVLPLLALSVVTPLRAGLNQDQHTLLLLHFDNNLAGVDGETPTQATGVTFEGGVLGKGVLVDGSDILTYGTAANFAAAAGTIEFWIKPRWNGVDGISRMFFSVGSQPGIPNNLILAKDGADNLVFIMGSPDSEAYQAYSLSGWQADEW